MPLTAVLSPSSAIIMMAAVYYGAMYGGSTTAIVVNIPGRRPRCPPPSTATSWRDRARGAAAWDLRHLAFVAGTLGLVGLTFFTPPLARIALRFGPPEYFALVALSLSLVVGLSGSSLAKGIVSACHRPPRRGRSASTRVGHASPHLRIPTLMAGLHFVAIVIGLFS
jgi:putative tricarboxylic transport membrane protein